MTWKWAWSYLKYYPAMESLDRDSGSQGQHLNFEASVYEQGG